MNCFERSRSLGIHSSSELMEQPFMGTLVCKWENLVAVSES